VAALIRSPGALRDWQARQAAEADTARARAEAEREQAGTVGLQRRRTLLGWPPGGVLTFTTAVFPVAHTECPGRAYAGSVEPVTGGNEPVRGARRENGVAKHRHEIPPDGLKIIPLIISAIEPIAKLLDAISRIRY
jgi:hypothetical protein